MKAHIKLKQYLYLFLSFSHRREKIIKQIGKQSLFISLSRIDDYDRQAFSKPIIGPSPLATC